MLLSVFLLCPCPSLSTPPVLPLNPLHLFLMESRPSDTSTKYGIINDNNTKHIFSYKNWKRYNQVVGK